MAGEHKGKAYEAIAYVVLSDLLVAGKVRGQVFWNQKPDGMSIEPDFVLGRNVDSPDAIILITHSGAAGNSHMKYWRNMGEMLEAKVFLRSTPKVLNLAFDSVIKEDLKQIQERSFDGQLLVGDRPYGEALQSWLDKNLASLPRDREERVEWLRERRKTDKNLNRLCSSVRADIERLLAKRATRALREIWQLERARRKGQTPASKSTSVRRGLSKLLIFEDVELALRIFSNQRVRPEDVPEYAFELNLIQKAIGRVTPVDPEALGAVSLLGVQNTRKVLAAAPTDAMAVWIQPLRATADLRRIHDWVISNLRDLKQPQKLLHWLQAVQADPSKPFSTPISIRSNWLYLYLCDLIKASAGLGQAVGYAQMLQLLRQHRADLDAFLHSLPLPTFQMKTQSFLDRGLRDWVNRLDTAQARSFSRSYQAAVAWALAYQLRGITADDLPSFEAVRKRIIQTNLEQKLVTYREFQPIRDLVRAACPLASMARIKSCFGEAAGLRGLASDTSLLKVNKTLVNWQSCSDAGRDHKKKELCGRAVSLRYSWNQSGKRFIPRPGVEKLILVLDGTWRQPDLEALTRAGWDEIFYPDEMDKLAKAIV